MARSLKEVSVKGLRKTHFTQLLSYLDHCDYEGWYYGHPYYFQKRKSDLESWLHNIIETYEAATPSGAIDE